MMSEASASATPRPRLIVRILGVLLILGFSTGVALVFAEIAVRIVKPQQLIQVQPDLYEPLDSIGYAKRPNVDLTVNTGERPVRVRTDAARHRVRADGPRAAATNVLLIGDSFMEALQVEYEQSVGSVLEDSLTARLGARVAVRDAGVGGWGPNHYLLRTRQLLARDTFALVVVAIFVGNDAVTTTTEYFAPRTAVERHHLRFPRAFSRSEFVASFLLPINDGLEVRSHLYILLKNQLSTLRMRLGLTADYMPLEYQRSEASSSRWTVTAGVARRLADAASAKGIETLFVLVPERFQVYPDEFDRYLRGFGIDSSTVDVMQPSRLLLAAFEAERLRVVDALPAFRAAAPSRPRLFGRVDQHLSPEGHLVLADVLLGAAVPLIKR